MAEETKKKTVIDCVREDSNAMKEFENWMSLIICHNLKDVPGQLCYRGCLFEVKLLGKMNKDGKIE